MFIQQEMTAEAFLAYAGRHPDRRFDFIDGEIVEVTPKPAHGRKLTLFAAALEAYTRQNPVGVVTDPHGCGYPHRRRRAARF